MVKSLPIDVKRVYDAPGPEDGMRILVDRLWPRGLSKEKAHLDEWIRDIAPSDSLRHWFGHDPALWEEFQRRYFAELKDHSEQCRALLEKAEQGKVTLLFSAHDAEHNNAVALRLYLQHEFQAA